MSIADFSRAHAAVNVNLPAGVATSFTGTFGAITTEPSMLAGENGFAVVPLVTVGETLQGTTGALNPGTAGSYTPVGNFDGIGAYRLDESTVRVLVNHEVGAAATYSISDGAGGSLALSGARISYFDVDVATMAIVDGGLAFDTIHGRDGKIVGAASQLEIPGGLTTFCSPALVEAKAFGAGRGTADRIYFAGEETSSPGHPHGGTEWALDVSTGALWAVPAFGRGRFENVAELDTGDTSHVAFLLDDNSPGAALYLYVGEKHAAGDFLDRNGLKDGQLYVWKSNTGELSPSQFPTGTRAGTFVPIAARDVSHAGDPGYDALGYSDDTTLTAAADALGAFNFRRPEDVSVNPANAHQAVFATTGIEGSSNRAGTLYTVTVDFAAIDSPTASLSVVYNGNLDAARRIRNPDNVDWAGDGRIYVQEDRATGGLFGPGAVNPHEASILSIDPATAAILRVAGMNRAAVPYGSADSAPADVGNWESSGILDVSALFGCPGGTLFLADVQAHSIVDGPIAAGKLSTGGQLLLIESPGSTATPAVSKVALHDVDKVIGSKFGDIILGDEAADDLRGGRGADRIDGAGGNDGLRGGRGSDLLAGKAGDDWLQGGAGADFLDGGANGIAGDTASYAASHRGVSVALALTLAQSGRGDAKGDVLARIENLVGSAHSDGLAGNGEANTLVGGPGRDTLTGGAGRDRLHLPRRGRNRRYGGDARHDHRFRARHRPHRPLSDRRQWRAHRQCRLHPACRRCALHRRARGAPLVPHRPPRTGQSSPATSTATRSPTSRSS